MSNVEDASREDLVSAVKRGQYVTEQLSARLAALLRENLELTAMLLEQQQNAPDPTTNGEVIAPTEPVDVTS